MEVGCKRSNASAISPVSTTRKWIPIRNAVEDTAAVGHIIENTFGPVMLAAAPLTKVRDEARGHRLPVDASIRRRVALRVGRMYRKSRLFVIVTAPINGLIRV